MANSGAPELAKVGRRPPTAGASLGMSSCRTRIARSLLRYGGAIVAIILATTTRLALDPVLDDLFPFATLFLSVLVVAGYGGRGPALLATGLGAVASARFLLPPRDGLRVQGFENRAGLVLYLVVGVGTALLGGALRAARRRAEADVEGTVRQREQFRITLSSIGDAVITTDAEGRVTSLNPVAEALTGWSLHEATGQPLTAVFRIVNEETRREVENPAFRALREGVIVGLANHTVLVARDGTERPIDDSAAPIRDESGGIVGVVLVFHDITERRRAEDERNEAQRQVATTLESITDGFMRLDRDWRVVFVNDEAERLNQLPRSETLGKTLWELFPAVVGTKLEAEYRRCVDQRVTVEFENHYEPWGRWYAIKGYPTPDGGLTAYIRDITDRRLGEEERRRLVSIVENSHDFIGISDAEGNPLFGNRAAMKLVGIDDLDQVRRTRIVDYFVPEQRRFVEEVVLPAVMKDGRWSGELTFRHFVTGAAIPVLYDLFRVDDPETGKPINFATVTRDITERRRAEEALRDSENESLSILESITDGFFALDHDWRFTYVNSAGERFLDRTPGDLIGKVLWEEYPGTVGSEFERVYRRVASGRAAESFTAHYPNFDRWYEVSTYPASDGLSVYFRDASDRKRAEQEIARLADESERQRRLFDTALSNSTDYNFIFDLDGRFQYANRALLELWGTTAERAIGKSMAELDYPEDVAADLLRNLRPAAETRRAVRDEVAYTSPVGTTGYFEYIMAPVLDDGGTVVQIVGSSRNIIDRKRAETALKASEVRYRRLFESSKDGVLILDAHTAMITDANPFIGELLGYSKGEFVGKELWQVGLFEDVGAGEAAMRELQEKRYIRYEDLPLETKAGRRINVEFVGSVYGEDGNSVIQCNIRDMTDRKRLEDSLRRHAAELSEADRRKDEFLATLAHELRNPLAPIRNGLQIMRMAGDDRRAIDESRTLMERQVTHMVRLIDDLLDVSRITRGKLELRRERVELATIVHNAVDTSRPLVEASGHELAVTLPARPIFVDADVTRLSQVFSNLLNNAAKYTERGGDIALAAERQGSDVVVAVRDNGVGIPPEMLPHVFDMFTQVDRSLERSQGGLGIGLTLVRTLVELHGGSVEARSGGHGLGSEFVVRLPIVVAASPTQPTAPAVAPSAGRRILVVDDNHDSARTLARLLKMLGHEARTAHDGGEAVEAAEEYRPEIMLLDIGLPVMNGYDVARTIRDRPWGREVVIIALTGWGQEGDRRRSKEAGIDHHLVKPVDPAALEKLLAGLEAPSAGR